MILEAAGRGSGQGRKERDVGEEEACGNSGGLSSSSVGICESTGF